MYVCIYFVYKNLSINTTNLFVSMYAYNKAYFCGIHSHKSLVRLSIIKHK